jgi:hypothetical protein
MRTTGQYGACAWDALTSDKMKHAHAVRHFRNKAFWPFPLTLEQKQEECMMQCMQMACWDHTGTEEVQVGASVQEGEEQAPAGPGGPAAAVAAAMGMLEGLHDW